MHECEFSLEQEKNGQLLGSCVLSMGVPYTRTGYDTVCMSECSLAKLIFVNMHLSTDLFGACISRQLPFQVMVKLVAGWFTRNCFVSTDAWLLQIVENNICLLWFGRDVLVQQSIWLPNPT